MKGILLKGLHQIGLTNLSDEQVNIYCRKKRTTPISPYLLIRLHHIGLTNLSDEQVVSYFIKMGKPLRVFPTFVTRIKFKLGTLKSNRELGKLWIPLLTILPSFIIEIIALLAIVPTIIIKMLIENKVDTEKAKKSPSKTEHKK